MIPLLADICDRLQTAPQMVACTFAPVVKEAPEYIVRMAKRCFKMLLLLLLPLQFAFMLADWRLVQCSHSQGAARQGGPRGAEAREARLAVMDRCDQLLVHGKGEPEWQSQFSTNVGSPLRALQTRSSVLNSTTVTLLLSGLLLVGIRACPLRVLRPRRIRRRCSCRR